MVHRKIVPHAIFVFAHPATILLVVYNLKLVPMQSNNDISVLIVRPPLA